MLRRKVASLQVVTPITAIAAHGKPVDIHAGALVEHPGNRLQRSNLRGPCRSVGEQRDQLAECGAGTTFVVQL